MDKNSGIITVAPELAVDEGDPLAVGINGHGLRSEIAQEIDLEAVALIGVPTGTSSAFFDGQLAGNTTLVSALLELENHGVFVVDWAETGDDGSIELVGTLAMTTREGGSTVATATVTISPILPDKH